VLVAKEHSILSVVEVPEHHSFTVQPVEVAQLSVEQTYIYISSAWSAVSESVDEAVTVNVPPGSLLSSEVYV
jgi:hypothetical protein